MFLSEIKGKITSEAFKEQFGDWQSDRWNQDEVEVKVRTRPIKEPSIATAGLEKSITGLHFDTIICDDLVTRENVTTRDQIEKVISYFESLIPILNPGGELIVIGTRWDELDLYGHIIGKLNHLFDIVVKRVVENGRYIFPEKFNDSVLATLRATMRPSFFSSQYYNEPIADEDQVFKKEKFRYWTTDKERGKLPTHRLLPDNLAIYTTVDLAVSENHDADETAIVTCGWDHENNMYVLDVKNARYSTSDKVEQIYLTNTQYKPYSVGIEKENAQKFFIDILRWSQENGREALPISELASGGRRKEDRIMNLEPLFRAGKVFLPEGCDALIHQLLKFTPQGTRGRDDIIDALAYQLKFYTPAILTEKTQSWAQKEIEKNPQITKDVQFYANADLWGTEEYNKQRKNNQEGEDPLDYWDSLDNF